MSVRRVPSAVKIAEMPKTLSTKIVLALAAVLWQSTDAALEHVAYGAANMKGWRLHQTAKLQGDCQAIVTPNAIKISIPKNKSYLIATTPFKEVTFYSLKTGKVCRVSVTYLRNAFEKAEESLNGFVMRQMPVVKVKTGTFKGIHTDVYGPAPTFAAEQEARLKAKIIPKRMPRTANFQTTQTMIDNPGAWKIVCMYYGTPSAQGYPLYFDYRDMDGDPHPFLNTIKIEPWTASESDFVVPSKLQPVKTPLEVNTGENDIDAIMLMMPTDTPKRH